MKNIPALAILIVGIVLLILGVNASDSVGSSISEAVNGAPTDKSMWLLGLGILVTVVGAAGMVRSGKSS